MASIIATTLARRFLDPLDLGIANARIFESSVESHATSIDEVIGPLVRNLEAWRDAKERGSPQLIHPFEQSVMAELDKLCPKEKKQCT